MAVDGWAVTFGTGRRGLGGAAARSGPSLYIIQAPLYITAVIGTLAIDGCAVTFGTARRGLGGL